MKASNDRYTAENVLILRGFKVFAIIAILENISDGELEACKSRDKFIDLLCKKSRPYEKYIDHEWYKKFITSEAANELGSHQS